MSAHKKKAHRLQPVPRPAPAAHAYFTPPRVFILAGAVAALAAAIWAYAPAMSAPALFDDNLLPFGDPRQASQPFSMWVNGQRPLLMASYWISKRLSPDDTWWFHFMNVLIHLVSTGLVFLIVRRLLHFVRDIAKHAGTDLLAAIAAALFLLHPLQTEAVAYLSGRSEAQSVMFALGAFTVFLYRREMAATWATAAAVLLLFGAALLSKEQTIALPALLLLTDYWWNPGFSFAGIRGNWRIYAPMVAAGIGGVWFFRDLITHAATAGFGLKDFTWYQYFFTECRALFVYMALFLFPVRQSADWDFRISHTILDGGAIFGLLALVALAAAAWRWRRRFPLASYGYFAFLILMAPTSSILPIKDPLAERRVYFGILGLLLIVIDLLARVRLRPKVLAAAAAAAALLLAVATHARASVWSGPLTLWQDAVAKSPGFWRPHFHLGETYLSEGMSESNQQACASAEAEFEKTQALQLPSEHMADLLVDWGLSYDCMNQPQQALAKLKEAAVMHPSAHVFSQIGMVYGRNGQWADALQTLAAAERLDPTYVDTYVYRGIVYFKMNQYLNAIQEYQRALAIDPANAQAQRYLQIAQQQLRGGAN